MDESTNPELFPSGFPAELIAEAFVHLRDAAWRPLTAIKAVDWSGAHRFAVLGTEVWLPKGDRIQSVPYLQHVDRRGNEDWDSFVARAASETGNYLKSFVGEFAKEGDVFINVVWVGESEFQSLKAT